MENFTDETRLHPVLTKGEFISTMLLQGILSNPFLMERHNHENYGIKKTDVVQDAIIYSKLLLNELSK